jgi:hypothetical protein
VVHWNTPTGTPRPRTRATAASISASGLMPVESSTGAPVSSTRSSSCAFDVSPDAIFQSGCPMRSSMSTEATEKGDEMKSRPCAFACFARLRHCCSVNSMRRQ